MVCYTPIHSADALVPEGRPIRAILDAARCKRIDIQRIIALFVKSSNDSSRVVWPGLFAALLVCLAAVAVIFWVSRSGLQLIPPFFLRTAGFDISWSLIPFSPTDPYAKVFLVGALNTLFLVVITIVFGTLLGIGVGVARRSSDFAVWIPARIFTEALVNTPLILQVLVWYLGIFALLPQPRGSLVIGGVAALNNRGVFLPAPVVELNFWLALPLLCVAIPVMARLAAPRLLSEGQWVRKVFPAFACLATAIFLAKLQWNIPKLEGFNYSGGWMIPPGLCVMIVALTLNNAAYVGEIVRAGLGAIPAGQTEAGLALGLRRWAIFRKVVLPQAIRIITPPMISQAQDVFKNCALSIVVGFPDLVSLWTNVALNQSGRATEILATTILFYLAGGILVSASLSFYGAQSPTRSIA